jgi:hypothetical protein
MLYESHTGDTPCIKNASTRYKTTGTGEGRIAFLTLVYYSITDICGNQKIPDFDGKKT